MSISREDLPEVFSEGVEYVTEEGWVDWRDITEASLALQYMNVVNAYEKYHNLASEFQEVVDNEL